MLQEDTSSPGHRAALLFLSLDNALLHNNPVATFLILTNGDVEKGSSTVEIRIESSLAQVSAFELDRSYNCAILKYSSTDMLCLNLDIRDRVFSLSI